MGHLRSLDKNVTRPNSGSTTRWGGMIDIYMWIGQHCALLHNEYMEPDDCVDNEDGTRYVFTNETSPSSYILNYYMPCIVGMRIMFSRTMKKLWPIN